MSIKTRILTGDALPALVGYVIVLMGIPSELVVHPLGAAGTPAQIIAIGLLAWWLASRVAGHHSRPTRNPMKWLMLAFAVTIMTSYVAGMLRPIVFASEISSSDRAILSLCAWSGIALIMIDGLRSRSALDTLLKVAAGGAAAIAVLGMIQFFFHLDLAHVFRIPGLSANHSFGGVIARSNFQRVTGTTSHPIEFGVVLSAMLPFAIHFARFAATATLRRRWWIASALIAAALPMSVARSAILGAAIVVLVMFFSWPADLRRKLAVAIGFGAIGMSFAVPGLLGTIRGLFLNASSDPSTQGRTADYAPVLAYVEQHPWFGRGIGTFIPSLYRTLDNQYLGTVVETGLIGLFCLLGLLIGGCCTAGAIRRRSRSEETRDLAQCMKAAIVALAINAATFDAFGFSMCAGIVFVLIGSVGALWELERRSRSTIIAPSLESNAAAGNRAAQLSIIATVVLMAAIGLAGIATTHPEYQSYATAVLKGPAPRNQTAFSSAGNAGVAASVVHDVMIDPTVRSRLARAGISDYQVAIGDGSLMMGSDVLGTGGPTLRFVTSSDSASRSATELSSLLTATRNELDALQDTVGVPISERITFELLDQGSPIPISGRPSRALIMLLAILVVISVPARQFWRTFARRSSEASTPPSARLRPAVGSVGRR